MFARLLAAVTTLSQRMGLVTFFSDRVTQVWMVNVRAVEEVNVTKGTNMATSVEWPAGAKMSTSHFHLLDGDGRENSRPKKMCCSVKFLISIK